MGDFHLVSLEIASDKEQLEAAMVALDEVDRGETIVFPEGIAATAEGAIEAERLRGNLRIDDASDADFTDIEKTYFEKAAAYDPGRAP